MSVSVKWLAVKTASEMTYTVSSGALNSTPTPSVREETETLWVRDETETETLQAAKTFGEKQ